MENDFTFAEAFDIVWGDVQDSVIQHATPMQTLTYAVVDMTPDELANTLEDDPRVYEAYLVVRDEHHICRRCHRTYDGTKPHGNHAADCTLRD